MNAKEFIHTIWICEPADGSIKVNHVTEAMEEYATHKIYEFIDRMPIGNEVPNS